MQIRMFFSLIVISLLYSNNVVIESVDFYPDGQVKEEKHFNLKDDKKTLTQIISYYENGKLKNQTPYKNRRKNGLYIEYYENQKKLKEGQFKNGFRVGKWTQYSQKGFVEKITTYKNGKEVSSIDYTDFKVSSTR